MNLTPSWADYWQNRYLQFIIVCKYSKEPALDEGVGRGFLGLVEAMEAAISKILKAGEEIPLRSSHQHSGGESDQLDGLPAKQKEAQSLWGESVSMQLFLKDNIEL